MNYTKFVSDCLSVFSFRVLFHASAAGTFRVATYNVENYLDQPTESRPHVKSAEAKAKIRESIERHESRRARARRNGRHQRAAGIARVAQG